MPVYPGLSKKIKEQQQIKAYANIIQRDRPGSTPARQWNLTALAMKFRVVKDARIKGMGLFLRGQGKLPRSGVWRGQGMKL